MNIKQLCDGCWSSGNGTVILTVYDNGEPCSKDAASADQIGIAVKDKNGVLIYSSNTYTASNPDPTAVLYLDGGNIQVLPSSATKSAEIATDIATAIKPVVENADLKVYPNPFSDRLRFEFVSPEAVNARIDLYDMTGRLVKTILEQPVEAGVSYQAEFRPETIISGMYIYRVTMGEAIYNGKVTFKK